MFKRLRKFNIYYSIYKKYNQMFFWFGIELFDSRKIEYGGFNHFIAGKIFKWKYCYLIISVEKQFKFNRSHEDDMNYYDGYHNYINIGFINISYGT